MATGPDFSLDTAGSGTVGRFALGADLIRSAHLSFSLAYDPEIGRGYSSQGGTARFSYTFQEGAARSLLLRRPRGSWLPSFYSPIERGRIEFRDPTILLPLALTTFLDLRKRPSIRVSFDASRRRIGSSGELLTVPSFAYPTALG